jgi:hypothetical protein
MEIFDNNTLLNTPTLEYHDDSGLLSTHGVKFCAYYAGGNEEEGYKWDYIVVNSSEEKLSENNCSPRLSVLGFKDSSFYDELNEFNQINNNPENFDLSEFAKFFEAKGHKNYLITPYYCQD